MIAKRAMDDNRVHVHRLYHLNYIKQISRRVEMGQYSRAEWPQVQLWLQRVNEETIATGNTIMKSLRSIDRSAETR